MYSPEIYSSLPISYPGVTIDLPSRADTARRTRAESSGIERSRHHRRCRRVVVSRAIPIHDTAQAIGFRSWKTCAPNGFSLSFTSVASSSLVSSAKRMAKRKSRNVRFSSSQWQEEHRKRIERGPRSIARKSRRSPLRIAKAIQYHCRITIDALSGQHLGRNVSRVRISLRRSN